MDLRATDRVPLHYLPCVEWILELQRGKAVCLDWVTSGSPS
jgi:hypothetical protein